MSRRHRLTVGRDQSGLRLDRAIAALAPDWTRSGVRRLIDQGRVTLNGAPAKPAATVAEGDELVVDEPCPQPLETPAQDIPLDVVFEDPDILVLNKPAGLVIHPAAGNPDGTLVNALLHHCQDLTGIGGFERPGIVHRLDKDTTGVMVVAKTSRAHLALSLAFRWHRVEKTYLAVCYGVPSRAAGLIDAPVGRHPTHRKSMAVVENGRPARTRFEVEERLHGTSVVHCSPLTGRTHQIRVHMAHIGHALVGDPVYAGRQWRNLSDRRIAEVCRTFPRQALHAWRLRFVHPIHQQPLAFEAPLPDDLCRLLEVLRG